MAPKLSYPCPPYNEIVSGFYDWRPALGAQHAAVDFPCPNDTPLLSPLAGTVTFAGWGDGNTGNMIEVSADGFSVRLLHLRRVLAGVGQTVAQGQHIGDTNNTGLASGPHLHMAVWAGTQALALAVQDDPSQAYGRWAVDPERLLTTEEDIMATIEELRQVIREELPTVVGLNASDDWTVQMVRATAAQRGRDFIIRAEAGGAICVLISDRFGTWKSGVSDPPTFYALGGTFTAECVRPVASAEWDKIPWGPRIKLTA